MKKKEKEKLKFFCGILGFLKLRFMYMGESRRPHEKGASQARMLARSSSLDVDATFISDQCT